MRLSGLFRTLKEKTYLSVTFTNSGNSSLLLFPLQLCHSVFIIPFLSQNYKFLYYISCVCMCRILLSAHLFAYTGLQLYSGDYFPRLHLINQRGFSASRDPQQLVLIPSGRSYWVFTPHRLPHLWITCTGSSGRQ